VKSTKLFVILTILLLMGLILIYGKNYEKNISVKKYFKSTEVNGQKYDTTWNSLAKHETPEWYKNAVLGIYFHWGIYSVPGFGCWGGRNMYQPNGGRSEAWGHIDKNKYANTYDYVKKEYGEPSTEFGYRDFIPMLQFRLQECPEQSDHVFIIL
jgi:alpha-L-fucosidase